MKANPKTVWVMLNNHEPYYVDKKESFSLTEGWSCVPYHLHPGNEVKLKRENAMMRDTLKALWDNRHVPSICINVATWEYIERKLPDLFKPNTKESK